MEKKKNTNNNPIKNSIKKTINPIKNSTNKNSNPVKNSSINKQKPLVQLSKKDLEKQRLIELEKQKAKEKAMDDEYDKYMKEDFDKEQAKEHARYMKEDFDKEHAKQHARNHARNMARHALRDSQRNQKNIIKDKPIISEKKENNIKQYKKREYKNRKFIKNFKYQNKNRDSENNTNNNNKFYDSKKKEINKNKFQKIKKHYNKKNKILTLAERRKKAKDNKYIKKNTSRKICGRPFRKYFNFITKDFLRFSITVKKNNIFCSLKNNRTNSIIKATSSGALKMKITRKRLKYSLQPFLSLFFKSIKDKKVDLSKFIVFHIVAPVKLRKDIVFTLSHQFLKKTFKFKNVFFQVDTIKIFNGCSAPKKIRKKRLGFKILK